MKICKKLDFKKIDIARLGTIKGGVINTTTENVIPTHTFITNIDCNVQTQFYCGGVTQRIACEYTTRPTTINYQD